MHPHPAKFAYSGVVYLKGASALRIVVDKRTQASHCDASPTTVRIDEMDVILGCAGMKILE